MATQPQFFSREQILGMDPNAQLGPRTDLYAPAQEGWGGGYTPYYNEGDWVPHTDPNTGQTTYQLGQSYDQGLFKEFITVPAIFAALIASAGAASGALGGAAAGGGAAGLEAGALAGAPGYGAALESSLAGAGAAGAAGSAGNWWDSLGLSSGDVGMSASPWTTDPALADLGGTIGSNSGLMETIQGLAQKMGVNPASLIQSLVSGMGGGGAGGTTGGGGAGNPLGTLAGLLSGINGLTQRGTGSPGALAPNEMNAWYQSIMGQALDPQKALHDRTQQQIVDASRAGSSARGLTMSPYSAGVENKAVSDFNIDWQNQALARNATGLGAVTGAMSPQNQAFQQNRAFNTQQQQGGFQDILNALIGKTGTAGSGALNNGGWLSSAINAFTNGGTTTTPKDTNQSWGFGGGAVPPYNPSTFYPQNYDGLSTDSSYYGGGV